MIASLTSTEFKSKLARIKSDFQVRLYDGLLTISIIALPFGIVWAFVDPDKGKWTVAIPLGALIGCIGAHRDRVRKLVEQEKMRCNACDEALINIGTVTPRFPVGVCSTCGSDTISDLAENRKHFTFLVERGSFTRGFYKSLGEEAAKLSFVLLKVFLGALAAIAGIVLALLFLLPKLRELFPWIFSNG